MLWWATPAAEEAALIHSWVGDEAAAQPTDLFYDIHAEGPTITIVVDLADRNELLGPGPYRPAISLGAVRQTATPTTKMVLQYRQLCEWDTPL